MVHGRMKAADKDTEMQKFISGEAQSLIGYYGYRGWRERAERIRHGDREC